MSDVRESFPAFCEQVLRQPLWPHQVEAAESDAFITTIAAARRTGRRSLPRTWRCGRRFGSAA